MHQRPKDNPTDRHRRRERRRRAFPIESIGAVHILKVLGRWVVVIRQGIRSVLCSPSTRYSKELWAVR